MSYRRCRRKWGWSSHLRGNFEQQTTAAPLWTGTGFHFALEDFHGYNRFLHPVNAFDAFVEAWKQTPALRLPTAWQDEVELVHGMLNYYVDHWLANRDPLQTYYYNGEPQIEVGFEIPLPGIFCPCCGEPVLYTGTIDKMVVDGYGRLWVLDYKTAKNMVNHHLELDQQMTTYSWAASTLYPAPVAGGIYQQHKKDIPDPPRWLSTGKFSVAKDQATTHHMYREALIKLYGEVSMAPQDNVRFLNTLAELEGMEKDKFIQRDYLERNEHQLAAEGEKILMEVAEMIDKDLPLYPNPTRDCSWDCDFRLPCLMMDDGSDWEGELDLSFMQRNTEETQWRQHLKVPELVDLQEIR